MANEQCSRQPVQDVWLTYTAYSPCLPCIPYETSECMHQIWSTKFTTCTLRMAIVKWSIRRVQDVWLTYTAYSQCSPSLPYVSSVIYGLMCAPNLVHEVYDLHRTYGRRTQHIVSVHQVQPIYHRCLWSNVCTKFGRSIRSGVWRIANVQWSIRPAQDVWLTYKEYSPCTPSIPMYHRWYMV